MTTVVEWDKGRPSKWVTETEAEFDVNERDNWAALTEYEESLCPQCRQPRVICEDPAAVFNPQIQTCYATVARSTYSRRWQNMHRDTKPDNDGWHPTDGAMVWVSEDLPPDAVFEPKPFNPLAFTPADDLAPTAPNASDDQHDSGH